MEPVIPIPETDGTLQYVLIRDAYSMHNRSCVVPEIVKTKVWNIQLLKLAPKLLCDLVGCQIYNVPALCADLIHYKSWEN